MNPLDWDLGNIPPGIVWGGVDGGTRSATQGRRPWEREDGLGGRPFAGSQRLRPAAPERRLG